MYARKIESTFLSPFFLKKALKNLYNYTPQNSRICNQKFTRAQKRENTAF